MLAAAVAAATALLDMARMAATVRAGLCGTCRCRCRMMLHVCCAGLLGICRVGRAAPTLHVKQGRPHHYSIISIVSTNSYMLFESHVPARGVLLCFWPPHHVPSCMLKASSWRTRVTGAPEYPSRSAQAIRSYEIFFRSSMGSFRSL